MAVSIKVAIRCRPFTQKDRLGLIMNQVSDEEGEVELINSSYSTSRFPFTYAWWSAFNYKRYVDDKDLFQADAMKMIDQKATYDGCGKKIKEDLLSGNAVVLFAYGLSGSGKTYTVFGPDATDAPEAWFKHSEPHNGWGIFPRLAYDIFQEKKDNWKITMKYFQNVVDTVRDLMSPNAEEQHYKNGMHKDADGFTDIDWCCSKVITSWNHLREEFQKANTRKAISPTQFNPMSTRGHCIMVLEIEMPNPDDVNSKQRGRVYVCDLAGTEPAGDIVYATYEKVTIDDGTLEYKYLGPHPDVKKTKELQEQGKKINLSLSEMSQFFMKMAEAVKAKKLTPGMSMPGCNSFFLCKYLKDTMLQARTYLFCAVRPEVEFLKYTFATLGFAKNASVVKLAPKKATVSASATERKMVAELDSLKQLVAQLQGQAGGGGEAAQMIADLQRKLAEKESEIARAGDESFRNTESDARAEEQRKEYAKRGISLVAFESETDKPHPYFTNLDEDAFRSNRFMYIISKDEVVFGNKGDIQLMSITIVQNHCRVKIVGDDVYIVSGKGSTYRNGRLLAKNSEEKLEIFDRIAMGDQLMLFRWKKIEDKHGPALGEPMSGEAAVSEFQEGIQNAGSGGELEEERAALMKEREAWEKEKKSGGDDYSMEEVDKAILEMFPKAKEAKAIVDLLNRVTMTIDVILERGADRVPRVKLSVKNSIPKMTILIDTAEFLQKLHLLQTEMNKLRNAVEAKREYELPQQHDPLFLMFDNDFHLGTSIHFPEYLLYNLETEDDDCLHEIKNSAVPYNTIGHLELRWKPLGGPNEEDANKKIPDINDEDELIGKPWTYRLEIKRAIELPVLCELAYVEYKFFGETFTTEVVNQTTLSPSFDYIQIHHIPSVTKEFIDFLKGKIEMKIYVTQHIPVPKDTIGTTNPIVVESIVTGVAKGYELIQENKSEIEIRCEQLAFALAKANEESQSLRAKVTELESKLHSLETTPGSRKSILRDAILTDSVINN